MGREGTGGEGREEREREGRKRRGREQKERTDPTNILNGLTPMGDRVRGNSVTIMQPSLNVADNSLMHSR